MINLFTAPHVIVTVAVILAAALLWLQRQQQLNLRQQLKTQVEKRGGRNVSILRSRSRNDSWAFMAHYDNDDGTRFRREVRIDRGSKRFYWADAVLMPSAEKREAVPFDPLAEQSSTVRLDHAFQPTSSKEQIIDDLSAEIAKLRTENQQLKSQ